MVTISGKLLITKNMINNNALANFLVFFASIIAGFVLEIVFSKAYYKLTGNPYKTHHYSLGKYIYFLILPIVILVVFLKESQINAVTVFVSFSILGTLAEWLIGFFYHRVVGQRLWTYHKYSITKYTSFLSLPLWGLAGLIFYLFIQIFL